MRQERIGEIFALSSGVLHGLFPILINYSVGFIPAIFYAGITNFLGAFLLLAYLIFCKQTKQIWRREAWFLILVVSFFIVIIPSLFIFVGTQYTSSINTAILGQAEIVFTFIICGLFFGEKITSQKVWGAAIIALGALAVLLKSDHGNVAFNKGDLLIIAGTAFYPIGNEYAKRALKLISPAAVMFLRSLFGGIILLLISFFLENTASRSLSLASNHFFYIAINSLLIIFIAKIIWYEALKRLDVTKAIPIISASPAFSLLFAVLFLHEIPTVYQIAGLLTIMLGLLFLTKQDGPLPHLK